MPRSIINKKIVPPQTVKNNCKRGLSMHEEGKTGSGIERQTIEVAKEIVAGEGVSEDWVKKANRWWARNERFLDEGEDSPAFAAALLWGGAAGRDWYRSKAKELGEEMSNKLKGQSGPVHVNITTRVNNEMIRRQKRDGRDVVVVKSATLPDDVVMNGILYPAKEIEKSYKTLEGSPAPLGHPTVNGMFVSARSPLGLNIGYFGAFNANVRRDNGRVTLEKVIDVERANESKMGRRVMEAIDKGDPIHTSTGLLMNVRDCTNSDMADLEGYDMEFDHDAILLDEEGAATPEQGVGMLVNKDGAKTFVVNSLYEEDAERNIDMLGMELMRAMDRKSDASRWERIKSAIADVFGEGRKTEDVPKTEETMEMDKEELEKRFDALNNLIETSIAALAESVTAVNEKVDGVATRMNAEAEAAKTELVNKIVEAKLLTKEEAEATPETALNALLKSASTKPAPGIYGGFSNNHQSYSLADDWEKEEA